MGKTGRGDQRLARTIAAAYSSKKNEMDADDPERTKVAVYLSRHATAWLTAELEQRWDSLLSSLATASEAEGDNNNAKGKKSQSSGGAMKTLTSELCNAPDAPACRTLLCSVGCWQTGQKRMWMLPARWRTPSPRTA